jgi:hypothetical protein
VLSQTLVLVVCNVLFIPLGPQAINWLARDKWDYRELRRNVGTLGGVE